MIVASVGTAARPARTDSVRVAPPDHEAAAGRGFGVDGALRHNDNHALRGLLSDRTRPIDDAAIPQHLELFRFSESAAAAPTHDNGPHSFWTRHGLGG